MDYRPGLNQLQLLDGETAGQKLPIDSHRRLIFAVIHTEMRTLQLGVITVNHFNHNIVKSAKFWQDQFSSIFWCVGAGFRTTF